MKNFQIPPHLCFCVALMIRTIKQSEQASLSLSAIPSNVRSIASIHNNRFNNIHSDLNSHSLASGRLKCARYAALCNSYTYSEKPLMMMALILILWWTHKVASYFCMRRAWIRIRWLYVCRYCLCFVFPFRFMCLAFVLFFSLPTTTTGIEERDSRRAFAYIIGHGSLIAQLRLI